MKKALNPTLALMLAFLLGATLTLAFAPYNLYPLGILAPAGLFALLLDQSKERAFKRGFAFGLGLFSTGIYWVFISIHSFGEMSNLIAGLITAALIAINALFPAAACYFTNRFFPASFKSVQFNYAFAALWVVSEWVRSWLFSGFTWMDIGYSQTNSPLKGYAPLLGVYSVSLIALLTSTLLVYAIIHYKHKQFRSLYFNLLTIFMMWMFGSLFTLIPWTTPSQKPLTISMVQGDIPQSLKWAPEHLNLSLNRYKEMSEPLWGKSDIIIWPEAAVPYAMQNAIDYLTALDNKAIESHTALILGIPIQDEENNGYFNGIITLGKDNQRYLKRRLVPFGEYVPFKFILLKLFGADSPLAPMSMNEGALIQHPFEINGVKILPSICYEITFPDLIRYPDKNIGLLLTVTNDAWFGKSSAQAQHLQMAQMRAIEFQRPLLFSSNNGLTAIINEKGLIQAAAPPYEPYVLTDKVQPMYGMTPWMRNGTDPVLVILIALIIITRRSKNKADATN